GSVAESIERAPPLSVSRWRRLVARGRRSAGLREQLEDPRAHHREGDAKRFDHSRRDALSLTDEAKEDVLGADVRLTHAPPFVDGELDGLLRAWRQRDLARCGAVLAATDAELEDHHHLRE